MNAAKAAPPIHFVIEASQTMIRWLQVYHHNTFAATSLKTGVGCRPYLLRLFQYRRSSWHRLDQGNAR
jgi:hypothetical protein